MEHRKYITRIIEGRSPAPRLTALLAGLIVAAALTALNAASCSAYEGLDSDKAFMQNDVYVGGEEGYETYRIPALLTTQSGTLLAFTEARRNGPADHGDIDLVVKRSTDNGATWSDMIIVHDYGEHTVGNPGPVQDRETGIIWLPFTIDNDTVHVTWSEDDGKTWAGPRDITEAVKPEGWTWYAVGPGHAIQLESGRLLVPCDHIESGSFHSHVIYSDDGGKTWEPGGSLPELTDEATAVELVDGSVIINMRSNHMRGKRAIARSKDGGESWSKIKFDSELIEPVCQGSILRYTKKDSHARNRILFSNPAARVRVKMTVKMSYDECRSWPVARLVNEGKSGYSDLAALPDMTIGLLYENGKKQYWEKITFARFTLEWLTQGEDSMENGK